MKKNVEKLKLHRETLRNLASGRFLREVGGATTDACNTNDPCQPISATCCTICNPECM
ncbi:MAG TPA: hypothetical protein VMM92_15090 [Thermoanaerobaculia bacterium]|nr:hypothetical protein [Thermoanaerobaculia bacterium]